MRLRKAKDLVASFPLLGSPLQRLYKRWRTWRYDPARHLGRVLGHQQELQVVQIGSHDGATDDPVQRQLLAHPGWKALLVEPVPFVFERLKARYGSEPRIQLSNLAVADHDGTLPFFYLAPDTLNHVPDLPHYWDQLGSFNRDHIIANFGERIAPCLMEVAIPCCTVAQLLSRHSIQQVNVLHIDTEGADWLILRQFDLKTLRPEVVIIEHKHLSATDRRQMHAHLSADYQVEDFGQDFFCTRLAAAKSALAMLLCSSVSLTSLLHWLLQREIIPPPMLE